MKRAAAARLALTLATLGGLGVFTLSNLRVSSDIGHFLTSFEDRALARVAAALSDSELSRTLILLVRAPTPETTADAARALADRLTQHPEVAWIDRGPPSGLEEAVYDLYFDRRTRFLSRAPELDLPPELTDAGLAASAAALHHQLTLPTAPLITRLAPSDPALWFRRILDRFASARPGQLTVRDDLFFTADTRQAVLFVGTRHGPFDADAQAPLLAAIDADADALARALGAPITVDMGGLHPYAVAAKRAIATDITRISVLSTAGLFLLLFFLMRSLRPLLLALLPLAVGLVAGLAAGLALLGELHGLTLAFGATLIGVCIDYPLHLYVHHTLGPPGRAPRASLTALWPALRLGAFTTVVGFAGLAASSLAALQEMAAVAIVGVLAALGTTHFLLPEFLPPAGSAPASLRRVAAAFARGLAALRARRRLLALAPATALVFSAVTLPLATWTDDLSALSAPDPATLAEDTAVRAQVAPVESGRVVVALAATEEAALQLNDRVADRLDGARARGVLGDYRSLTTFLWSEALQQRNLAEVRRAPQLAARFVTALTAAGFRPEAFAPLAASLERASTPLTWAALAASPLARLVRPFRIDGADQVGLLTFLSDVRDPTALSALFTDLDGVRFVDQRALSTAAFAAFRERATGLVALGLIGVLLLIGAHYRRPRWVLAAALPAILACSTTLGALSLAGAELNLLHLVATLLVFSMGVDYGVFFVSSRAHRDERAATALGVTLACLSTVLGFGLLAISDQPALRALGLTIGVGVLVSVVLATSLLLLLDAEPRP